MADKGPRILQTLPPDGLVAEEIIDDMREEYGYPATPQEYRLIIRVAAEEPERQNGGRRRSPAESPAAGGERSPAPQAGGEQPTRDPAALARRGRLRRRRRGKGRGGAVAAGEAGTDRLGTEDTGAAGEGPGGDAPPAGGDIGAD